MNLQGSKRGDVTRRGPYDLATALPKKYSVNMFVARCSMVIWLKATPASANSLRQITLQPFFRCTCSEYLCYVTSLHLLWKPRKLRFTCMENSMSNFPLEDVESNKGRLHAAMTKATRCLALQMLRRVMLQIAERAATHQP